MKKRVYDDPTACLVQFDNNDVIATSGDSCYKDNETNKYSYETDDFDPGCDGYSTTQSTMDL